MSKDTRNVPALRFKGFSNAWEKRKLIYFLNVSDQKNSKGTFSKKDVLSVSGEFGIVNQIQFQGRSFAGVSVKKYGIVEKGDIVYTKSPLKRNPFGIIKVNRGQAGIVSTLYAIYKPRKTVCPSIIDYYFQSDTKLNNYLRPLVNKGAKNDMKVKNIDVLKGLVILPLNLDEQKKDIFFLDNITNLIAATQQKISDLEDIKVSTLRNLFNQTWRIRHYSDDWKNIKLSDISTKVVEKNVNYQYKAVLTNSAEFGIVNQQDFFDKSIANPKSLSGYYVIHPNDFVYNPRISKLAPVGPIRRNKTGRIGVMSPLYYVFKIDGVDPTFLEYFFKNNGWHRFMYANGDTGARADRFAIKDKVFEQMPIRLPSKDEQEALGTFLKALERLIAEFLKRLDDLKKLKKYLLSSMFA